MLLTVRRLRCEAYGARFGPADVFVTTLGSVNITARLRDACVLAGSSWLYQTAALVLRNLCGADRVQRGVRAAPRQCCRSAGRPRRGVSRCNA